MGVFLMLPAARQHFPDELRGFALLGIILVNAPFLGISTLGFTRDLATPWWDHVAEFIVVAFFQGKFYLLFAFLFGYSAHLILQAGNRTAHFARRLLGLALVGIGHALLFFVGDILLSYALLGIILLFAWRWPERKLLYGAACAASLAVGWMLLLAGLATLAELSDAQPSSALVALDAALQHGSFLTTLGARAQALPEVLLVLGSLNWGLALACFYWGWLQAEGTYWLARKNITGYGSCAGFMPSWLACR
jgi:uncharacterized protein